MAKQTILITALPNGFTDNRRSALRISLLISPRLESDDDTTLASFPDFVDWPGTIAQSRFQLFFGNNPAVEVNGNSTTGNRRLDKSLGLPDPKAWAALFPADTRVKGYEFRDVSSHRVLSYETDLMNQTVRDLYSSLAVSASDRLPTPTELINQPVIATLGQILREHDRTFTDKKGIRQVDKQFKALREFRGRDLRANLARFELFHTPSARWKPRVDKLQPGETKRPAEWGGYDQSPIPAKHDFQSNRDFHRMVAAMNQYPVVLRRLGLVVDLIVPTSAFPLGTAELSAEMVLPDPSTVERVFGASPTTNTLLDDSHFRSNPRPMSPQDGGYQIKDGLLDLAGDTFGLLQADVDGSSLKLVNLVRTLMMLNDNEPTRKDPVTQIEREMGAPSLRNAGLMLVHKQRGKVLEDTVARQKGFNKAAMDRADAISKNKPAPKPPSMFTQDLIRGYRIDIWDDKSEKWHSLCERRSIYDIADGKVVIDLEREEGTVRLAATTSVDKSNNGDIIWLHEALVSWTGWGLCAPPPGKTIHHQTIAKDDDGNNVKDEDGNDVIVHEDPVGDPEPEVPPEINMTTQFRSVKGSLPRLRYGRRYWIRARAVDLAGNSLAPQPKDFGPEQTKDHAEGYFRFDPISAPALALVNRGPQATEVPHEGESMERIAIRTYNDQPLQNTIPSTEHSRRFAVPSRTTQREAEHHGMFDQNGKVDSAFYSVLVKQDNSLPTEIIKMAGPLDKTPVDTKFAVMTDGDDLPYLPDPVALTVAARIFDHPTFPSKKIINIPFYANTKWPKALPFKIEVYENPGDVPRYDEPTRTLLIPLPKAARATLRLSIQPDPKDLALMGVWNWLKETQRQQMIVVDGQSMTRQQFALNGQHWMITPWRNVELVHAVQRPLITPELDRFLLHTRRTGETAVEIGFQAPCSIASTDRLDLRAEWNEPHEENIADILPDNRNRIDHAYSIKITDPRRFGGQPECLIVPHETDRIQVGNLIDRPFGAKKHEFHDTRYRRIEYWLEGTTKFREFMPPGLLLKKDEPTEENINVVGKRRVDWIKSSASPPAPEVLYVVPTFGWVRSSDKNTRNSWRRGGGLRVYLNRPWNASGYGEMLAVVMPGAGFHGDPEKSPAEKPAKNFVTQWGIDPIWVSANVSGIGPKLANFPLTRTKPDPDGKWLPKNAPLSEADQRAGNFKITDLSHPDFPNTPEEARVDIAPHDVFFDEERQLWYCDIEVAWGTSYYPFIRLALARYQPESIFGAHLSNVVLADFMPLIPDRWLNVTHTNDIRTRRVTVYGNSYSDSGPHHEAELAPSASFITPSGPILVEPPDVAETSVVEVWVERFEPTFGEDFGWVKETHAIVSRSGKRRPVDVEATPATRLSSQLKRRVNELVKAREFEALLDEKLIDQVFFTPRLWDGSVTLPGDAPKDTRYRLAIAEYEEYIVDDRDNAYDRFIKSKGRRLVFMEYVEL
jgi:hypothetical protein